MARDVRPLINELRKDMNRALGALRSKANTHGVVELSMQEVLRSELKWDQEKAERILKALEKPGFVGTVGRSPEAHWVLSRKESMVSPAQAEAIFYERSPGRMPTVRPCESRARHWLTKQKKS